MGLDEAHEMEINLKSKNALNSYSQPSLAILTYYLPFRAEILHNFKKGIQLDRDDLHHRETSLSYVITEERTILEYVSKLQSSSLFVLFLITGRCFITFLRVLMLPQNKRTV